MLRSLLLLLALVAAGVSATSFWHITDIHVDTGYQVGGNVLAACRLPAVTGVPTAGPFGSYYCDTPVALANSAFNYTASLAAASDFVLWTGDDAPHLLTLDMETVWDSILLSSQYMSDTFGTKVIPTMGNHDWFPVYDLPGDSDPFYTNVSDLWASYGWLTPQQQATFAQGGYYWTQIPGTSLRVVALNTALYINRDTATLNVTDPAGQLQWLNETLAGARAANQTVYIAAHAPPGYAEKYGLPIMYPQDNDAYLGVIALYSDIIVAHFYGHEHSDAIRFAYAWEGATTPTGVMFIAPSVTPWFNVTGYPGIAWHNPALRLVETDPVTYQVTDLKTYWLNLSAANAAGIAQWQLEYSFRVAYQVTAPLLNASTMWSLYSTGSLNTADGFSQYVTFNSVSYTPLGNCTWDGPGGCERQQRCAIEQPYSQSYITCVNAIAYRIPKWMWLALAGAAAATAILVIFAVIRTGMSMMSNEELAERRPLIN
jgi:hypothetical protein